MANVICEGPGRVVDQVFYVPTASAVGRIRPRSASFASPGPGTLLALHVPVAPRPFRKAQHQTLGISKTTASPSLPEPLITVVGKAKQQTFVPSACDQLQTHRFSFVGQACRKADCWVATEVECPGQSDTDRLTGAVVAMGREWRSRRFE